MTRTIGELIDRTDFAEVVEGHDKFAADIRRHVETTGATDRRRYEKIIDRHARECEHAITLLLDLWEPSPLAH